MFDFQKKKEKKNMCAFALQAKFWPLDGRLLQCTAEFQMLDL